MSWMFAMRRKAGVLCAAVLLAVLAGLVSPAIADDPDARWAFVENQTNDTIVITYTESVEGNRAKSSQQVYAGSSRRLDATVLRGDVCAWTAQELQPAQQIGCRTLSPGDRWVIH